jgi:hypothetical protein
MASISDNFTDSDATALQDHTASGGGTYTKIGSNSDLQINSNSLNAAVTNGWSPYYHSTAPDSANHEISADFSAGSEYQTTPFIAGRVSTNGENCYWMEFSDRNWVLFKRVGGSGTQLGSYNGDYVTTVRRGTLRIEGTTISVLVDDVERISVSDSDISAAGRFGVGCYYANTGSTIDNLAAQDISAPAATPIPVFMNQYRHRRN